MNKVAEEYPDVSVVRSHGRSRNGVTYYVRPSKECLNRSRPICIYDHEDSDKRIKRMIVNWYWPMKYWKIDGVVIGANSEGTALKEYWRICDPSKNGVFIKPEEIK